LAPNREASSPTIMMLTEHDKTSENLNKNLDEEITQPGKKFGQFLEFLYCIIPFLN
jgi:hypothetical protein